jgi:hypothetical protein
MLQFIQPMSDQDEDSDPIYQENPEFPEDEDQICDETEEDLTARDELEILHDLLEKICEDARKGMFPQISWEPLVRKMYVVEYTPTTELAEGWIALLKTTKALGARDWRKILKFAKTLEWEDIPAKIQSCFSRLRCWKNLLT